MTHTYVYVPLSAGQGNGREDWDNAFTRDYASDRNAIRLGLTRAAAGQYAVYDATPNGTWGACENGVARFVAVTYRLTDSHKGK